MSDENPTVERIMEMVDAICACIVELEDVYDEKIELEMNRTFDSLRTRIAAMVAVCGAAEQVCQYVDAVGALTNHATILVTLDKALSALATATPAKAGENEDGK